MLANPVPGLHVVGMRFLGKACGLSLLRRKEALVPSLQADAEYSSIFWKIASSQPLFLALAEVPCGFDKDLRTSYN